MMSEPKKQIRFRPVLQKFFPKQRSHFLRMSISLSTANSFRVFINTQERLEITIDDEKREDSYSLAHIANGTSYNNGTKDEEGVEDGVIEYILVKKCSLIKKLKIIKKMINGTLTPIDDVVYIGCCKRFSIEEKSGKNIVMTYDGRREKRRKLEGNVRNKMVKIVVPQIEKYSNITKKTNAV